MTERGEERGQQNGNVKAVVLGFRWQGDQTDYRVQTEYLQSLVYLCTKSTYSLVYIYIQWGEQVFDTLPILHVFLLTKHVDVCIIGTLQL